MRKYVIYAVDFDGTLCESVWPGIGAPNMALIEHLIKRRSQGHKIILWTCRVDEKLQEAVDWCKNFGLEFDAVNANLPEMIKKWDNDPRKIFADVYIDDKFKCKPNYQVPYHSKALQRNDDLGIFDAMLSSLPDTPLNDDGEKNRFWADKTGDCILCSSSEGAEQIANFIECSIPDIVAKTGYFDPGEDERNNEVDKYTGFYYVEIE